VIAIDGPTASGKGTLAARVAQRLGYHLLDSGSLYRATALAALRAGRCSPANDEAALALAAGLTCASTAGRILLAGEDVAGAARGGGRPGMASRVSALPAVRGALHGLQLSLPAPARPGGRRARHGHGGLPGRPAQGVPHRRARRRAPSAAISN
jgi:3-phosphoshikimate 1-carboxyvinyltransferase